MQSRKRGQPSAQLLIFRAIYIDKDANACLFTTSWQGTGTPYYQFSSPHSLIHFSLKGGRLFLNLGVKGYGINTVLYVTLSYHFNNLFDSNADQVLSYYPMALKVDISLHDMVLTSCELRCWFFCFAEDRSTRSSSCVVTLRSCEWQGPFPDNNWNNAWLQAPRRATESPSVQKGSWVMEMPLCGR